ncbi:MAG: hypothetical protein HY245_05480 [Rhizobiales bacterium]|nr:hypothetical protein [Hyphomicrobiales bacterium]MBI3672865.1 hypothetical protein [Hyphomicrobiales bacterium]
MKSLLGLAAAAVMIFSLPGFKLSGNFADWANGNAQSRYAAQMLADNMTHMR